MRTTVVVPGDAEVMASPACRALLTALYGWAREPSWLRSLELALSTKIVLALCATWNQKLKAVPDVLAPSPESATPPASLSVFVAGGSAVKLIFNWYAPSLFPPKPLSAIDGSKCVFP